MTRCEKFCSHNWSQQGHKKQNQRYNESKLLSSDHPKNPANTKGNINWIHAFRSAVARHKSLNTTRSNTKRKLANAILKLKSETQET